MSDLENLVPEIFEMKQCSDSDEKIKELQSRVRNGWKARLSINFVSTLYEGLINNIDVFLDNKSNGSSLYFFVETFSSSDYLSHLSDKTAEEALIIYHEKLLFKISELITREDRLLVTRQQNAFVRTRGNLGDLIANLIELYFYHTSYDQSEIYSGLRRDASQYILPFVIAFPKNGSNLIASLIQYNDDAVNLFAKIIHQCVISGDNGEEGLLTSIALDMFSLYTDKGDFEYKKLVLITRSLMKLTDDWNKSQINLFIEKMILYPLRIPDSIDNRIDKIKRSIGIIEKRVIDGKSTEYDEKLLKDNQKELEFISSDPAGYLNKCLKKASQKIAVFKNMLKSIEIILSKWPHTDYSELLQRLVNRANEFANKPKLFPLNKKPSTLFKDISFKLMVIEELMYNQKVLEPVFDIHQFIEEYTGRDISFEEDGYEVIPEVLKYFKNLEIPEDKRLLVTELYQDGGVDGGAEIYNHLWPFWDPGAGDELLPVTNKAKKDLELLPNLKLITGLENCKPPSSLIKALTQREIELREQEN